MEVKNNMNARVAAECETMPLRTMTAAAAGAAKSHGASGVPYIV